MIENERRFRFEQDWLNTPVVFASDLMRGFVPREVLLWLDRMERTLDPLGALLLPVYPSEEVVTDTGGKTVYHNLTGSGYPTAMVKGGGSTQLIAQVAPNYKYSGYPYASQHAYFGEGRVWGALTITEGSQEFINSAVFCIINFVNGYSAEDLLAKGISIPLILRHLPDLTNALGKYVPSGEARQMVRIVSAVPSTQRVTPDEWLRKDHASDFFVRNYETQTVAGVARSIRAMIDCGLMYGPSSAHRQNFFYPSGGPADFADVQLLGDYKNEYWQKLLFHMLNNGIIYDFCFVPASQVRFGIVPDHYDNYFVRIPAETVTSAQNTFFAELLRDIVDQNRIPLLSQLLTVGAKDDLFTNRELFILVADAVAQLLYGSINPESIIGTTRLRNQLVDRFVPLARRELDISVDPFKQVAKQRARTLEHLADGVTPKPYPVEGVHSRDIQDYLQGGNVSDPLSNLLHKTPIIQ